MYRSHALLRYDALLAKHTVQATGGARRTPAERSYRERKEREAGLDDGEALDVAGNGDMETCQNEDTSLCFTRCIAR